MFFYNQNNIVQDPHIFIQMPYSAIGESRTPWQKNCEDA